MTSILVLGELTENRALDPVTGELIAAARQIGDDIGVALLGSDLDERAEEAIALGASSIYTVDDEALTGQEIDPKVTALTEVCNQASPDVLLVGKTQDGREIGPRVAFRLGAGLAQDCIRVGVDADTGRVVATRPVYGGSAMAAVTFPGDGPQVVVMRGRAYEPSDPDASRTGDVIPIAVDLSASPNRVRNIRTVAQAGEGVRLEDADIVVAGGRGLGGPEPFEMVGSWRTCSAERWEHPAPPATPAGSTTPTRSASRAGR